MIISRTPYRVSFFGGGTDYPAWYREHGGAVLSTTIDKYCYISVRELPPFFEHKLRLVYSFVENVQQASDLAHPSARAVLQHMGIKDGLEIHHDGDLPARSGMGSSSAFTVGLLNALHAMYEGHRLYGVDVAQEAIHVEQELLGECVGTQDQIAAAYGGFNHIVFRRDGGWDVNRVSLPAGTLEALQDHCLLFFTGLSRTAGTVAKSQLANMAKRTAELKAMAGMVDESISLLAAGNLDGFGALLLEGWMLKRQLSDRVSTSDIDSAVSAALLAGATGGKLLGAGGGGFLLLFVPPERRGRVREALSKLIEVPFRFESSGSRIVLYQPAGWAA